MKNPPHDHFDPFGIGSSFLKVHLSWVENSQEFFDLYTGFVRRIQETNMEEMCRLVMRDDYLEELIRKRDEMLTQVKGNAQSTRRFYTIYQNWLKECIDKVKGLEEREKRRAGFWMMQFVHALAPSNYFWTNPTAVQRCIDSSGETLRIGLTNWLADIDQGEYLPKMADSGSFRVGENIACTPGFVIFRNHLMELIQYSPTTETTYAMPIVFIQPWVNKFYIFDLGDQNSFVRFLLGKGFTVFIVSWKNPTTAMRHITFADYMLQGALKAIDVARAICKVRQVHAAGYCIGGTALAALMAWLNRKPGPGKTFPIADFSLFSALVDFSEPGELGVFVTERTLAAIEEVMKKTGYLDGKYMDMAFRMLRSDSLIWRNFVNNYLCGGTPPPSDMLYWNSDHTNLPEAMFSFYLREFYLNNRLVEKDGVKLGNRDIDLGRIVQPLYVVGALQDHISPWQGTFRTGRLVSGPVRYVLASEGHITGIVNPPSEFAKKKYWLSDGPPNVPPEVWLAAQQEQRGSWWNNWVAWLSERSQPMGKPPSMGSRNYPPLAPAPGSYVLEKPRINNPT